MKKIPQRTCVVCREKVNKNALNRIVKNSEGQLFFDPTGKANGRGAYICSREICIDSIDKVLSKVFKTEISKEVKVSIKEEITNVNTKIR